ncbi:MAG: hypothetical protein Q7T24_06265 [Deltaproteobacteria bacterium]|nr:hypothetical protein [Deltaproteobacteria bacterium]
MEKSLYSHLAGLLEYPKEDIKIRVEECVKALAARPEYPSEAVEELKKFQRDLEEMPLDDLQGVFSYTFELSSDFTLDMGYHLFDGFKRSNMLATVKSMFKETGFPSEQFGKGELPDHLPVLLHFLSFVQDEALKKDFRESFVILGMEKLLKNFEKNKKNIYSHLISAIYRVLDKDVKEAK